MLNSEGASTDSWSRLSQKVHASLIYPLTRKWYLWLLNVVARSHIVLWHLITFDALSNSPRLHTMSYAEEKSISTVPVFRFHLKPASMWPVMVKTKLWKLRPSLKPAYCFGRMASTIGVRKPVKPYPLTGELWRGVILGNSWFPMFVMSVTITSHQYFGIFSVKYMAVTSANYPLLFAPKFLTNLGYIILARSFPTFSGDVGLDYFFSSV